MLAASTVAYHAGDTRLVLVVLGVAAAYVLLVLARPAGTCWRCHGRRIIRKTGRNGRPGRARPCAVCRGHGVARRPGATVIHRVFQSVLGDRIRERQRQRAAGLLTRKERQS